MELRKEFEKCKNYATDGHPDIFWPWISWCCVIIVVVIGIAHLGISFLKYKGIL
jgi:hypothetical protein